MTIQMPAAPFRINLASALTAAGRSEEASAAYTCGCSRTIMAAGFFDVRDQPENFAGQSFVCLTCASDLMRREAAAHEDACRKAMEAAGILDEETLNGLRAQRDLALVKSDWTQLADNRQRIGAEMSARWDAYRADCRDWFAVARDTGVIASFPTSPE